MGVTLKKESKVDLSQYKFSFSLSNKIGRLIWNISYLILFRPFNLNMFNGWRAGVLKMFGAKVGYKANICASVKIWAPWNLEIGDYSCLGPKVECYNQGKIVIGKNSVISQKVYLCASSHDFTKSNFPLILKPITIEDSVWIAADAYVAPGKTIREGCVVAARAAVFKDTEPWSVFGGNPSKYIKDRIVG